MHPSSDAAYIAFDGDRRIATGDLREIARLAKAALEHAADASVLIFDWHSSRPVDLDFRGTIDDVLARLPAAGDAASSAREMEPEQAPNRGPGRPKLGVVAREITLLPRHWEWLAQQPGGASVAIRKLVEEARRNGDRKDRIRAGAGSGLSLHVGDGRQQASFRRRRSCAVRSGSRPICRLDCRLARRCARPCRAACRPRVSRSRARVPRLIPLRRTGTVIGMIAII